MNTRKKVLLLDDEERILRSLSLLLRNSFEISTTTSPQEALRWVEQEAFDIIISDQRMPLMDGAEFLSLARDKDPHPVRLLLTGYSDINASIRAVNEGAIFRYLTKPWHPAELRKLMEEVRDMAQQSRAADSQVGSSAHRIGEEELTCLVLDKDPLTFEVTRRLLGNTLNVLWASSVAQAVEVLNSQPVAIMVTELWVDDKDISLFLRGLKQAQPQIITLVVSELKESHRLVDLINQARIFRYLPKPLRLGMLNRNLESALVHYHQVISNPVTEALHVSAQAMPEEDKNRSQGIWQYLSRGRRQGSPLPR